jgi:hypothetical protein
MTLISINITLLIVLGTYCNIIQSVSNTLKTDTHKRLINHSLTIDSSWPTRYRACSYSPTSSAYICSSLQHSHATPITIRTFKPPNMSCKIKFTVFITNHDDDDEKNETFGCVVYCEASLLALMKPLPTQNTLKPIAANS